jgi:YD repeat-containing protein
LADGRPDFLKEAATHAVLAKDGREWHFTPRGDLVAIKDGPQVTVLERDPGGRVPRIIALLGGVPSARMDLEYTSQGALAKVTGTALDTPQARPTEVVYAYDASGRLAGVASAAGTVGYAYQGPWVVSVTWKDKTPSAPPVTLREFEYNGRGQLVLEKSGGRSVSHTVATVAGGLEASATEAASNAVKVYTRYDAQLRPLEAVAPDGTHATWSYRPDGTVEITAITPDRKALNSTNSANGRERSFRAEGGPNFTAHFDAGGHLTNLVQDNRMVLAQQWRPDGQLAAANTDAQGVTLRYDEAGLLSSMLFHPPNAGKTLTEWQETQIDRRGNPVEVKDYTGLDAQFAYDASGVLVSAIQRTPEGNVGFQLDRDATGRIQALKSSWGDTAYRYTKEGDMQRIETKCGGQSASLELLGGLILKVAGFDGGVTTLNYHDQGSLAGALQCTRCANGLELRYDYNVDGCLESATVGTTRRVRFEHDSKGRVVTYTWEPAGSLQEQLPRGTK